MLLQQAVQHEEVLGVVPVRRVAHPVATRLDQATVDVPGPGVGQPPFRAYLVRKHGLYPIDLPRRQVVAVLNVCEWAEEA